MLIIAWLGVMVTLRWKFKTESHGSISDAVLGILLLAAILSSCSIGRKMLRNPSPASVNKTVTIDAQ